MEAILQALAQGVRCLLVVAPTGSGKTVLARQLVADPRLKALLGVEGRPLRVLFIAHNRRLLTQASRTFADSGVELIPQSLFTPLSPEGQELGWDIGLLDESHHEGCRTVQLRLTELHRRPLVGFTATPERSDQLLLKLPHRIEVISRDAAVAWGYLAGTHIHSVMSLSPRDNPALVRRLLQHYHGAMTKAVVFVPRRHQVHTLVKTLQDLGETALPVLDQRHRALDQLLDRFAGLSRGFLVNCGRLGEGVDLPDLDTVVLGNQPTSRVELNQRIGRGARPASDNHVYECIDPLNTQALCTADIVGDGALSHRLYCPRDDGGFEVTTLETRRRAGFV
ncbi:MAG: DEAD/DEAH box helicase [Candidatus Competibacterales bacterium]